MADQLVTPAELASHLQTDVDTSSATQAIEVATGVVQAAAGQRIVRVVDDVVVLDLDEIDSGRYLNLPEWPVTAVGTVLVGATTVTDAVAQLSRGRLYRASGWRSVSLYPYASPSTATVTYTHGLAAGDQRLQLARSVALNLAAAVYTNPASGVVREQIDDYAVQYDTAAARLDQSPFLIAALRRRYARPRRSVLMLKG